MKLALPQLSTLNLVYSPSFPQKLKVYPNNKSYITKDMKQIMNLRKLVFKNKDTTELQKRDKELRGTLRKATKAHTKHLEEAFKAGSPRKTWDTFKNMTGMPR